MSETNDLPIAYGDIHTDIVQLLENARRAAARSINTLMTASYWEIGRRIVEFEQGGEDRAAYGEALIQRLALDLTKHFGRGFSYRNLSQRGVAIFAKACFGHPSPIKQQKLRDH